MYADEDVTKQAMFFTIFPVLDNYRRELPKVTELLLVAWASIPKTLVFDQFI